MGANNETRRRAVAGACVALVCLLGCTPPPPDAIPQTPGRLTDAGLYRIHTPDLDAPPALNEVLTWDVRVQRADGGDFVPDILKLDATMPGHGHGMGTSPTATRALDSGAVRVEGLQFHMSGLWRVHISVLGPDGPDALSYDLDLAPPPVAAAPGLDFSRDELALLKSLTLDGLGAAPRDPSNRFSGNAAAAELGAALFADPGLSATGTVSCASCHDPARYFTDALPRSRGTALTQRHAPSLIGVAHATWFYWDGRRDSLWAQAVTPLETRGEMDATRSDAVAYVLSHPDYAGPFRSLSGHGDVVLEIAQGAAGAGPFADPAGRARWQALDPAARGKINAAFADIGKMLAAYQETLTFAPSRFDRFAAALLAGDSAQAAELLDAAERRGARLFIDAGRSACLRCHNGPLLTNQAFHNIGTGAGEAGDDAGRALGLQAAQLDEFNCLGPYSDAQPADCTALRFARVEPLHGGAFKTPSLRNVAHTAPYLHDGRFATLREVVDWYAEPPPGEGHAHELPQLPLSAEERDDLVAFLRTL